jgi:hypothetical protein
VQSLIPRFHFKCIKLSDEEAEKIRKSISPLARPFTNSIDDYICENCHAATGKKTTSKSNTILILLTPHLSVPVDSLLCHLLPIPIHYYYVYCLLGLICSAILYAGRHVLGCWIIAVSVFASVPIWQLDLCPSQPRPVQHFPPCPSQYPRPEQKKELIGSGIRCQDVQLAVAPRW